MFLGDIFRLEIETGSYNDLISNSYRMGQSTI